MTDAFVFVSQYEADAYAAKVGPAARPVAVVRNGLRPEEFEPDPPAADARDFLFIGELPRPQGAGRLHRGARRSSRPQRQGADGDHRRRRRRTQPRYEAMVRELGLVGDDRVPSTDAGPRGLRPGTRRCPTSRAESMPYIVLEALAAGMPTDRHRRRRHPRNLRRDGAARCRRGDAQCLADGHGAAIVEPPTRPARMPPELRSQVRAALLGRGDGRRRSRRSTVA